MSSSVFVVNCGSSSVKYSLIDVEAGRTIASDNVERVTTPEQRRQAVLAALAGSEETPGAFAHRVVHGGERFVQPTVIDDEVLNTIRELSSLAPLHNPANADGIEIAREAFPDVPHVAVFDTAFHHTLPARAYTYAVPREWAERFGVRRYGFHGTSHAYVSRAASQLLGRPPSETNLIVLHLGNGASATAVRGGESVDTSMGLTPLEGLVMGTRSGDLDPGLLFHLMRVCGLEVDEVDAALNKRSGMLGLAGTNDLRDVEARAAANDKDAALALEVYCYRLRKYVGAYHAALGRLDAIVFTAGVGENQPLVRAKALDGLEPMGIAVDAGLNSLRADVPRFISAESSKVAVMVVPTDEELEMARQALHVIEH